MSRLNRFVQLGAILSLLAAAAPAVVTPTAGAVGPVAPAAVNPPDMTAPGPGSQWPDPQQCPLSSHDMGPLGPMGPWGPHGPLHDKPHAACVGGDPISNSAHPNPAAVAWSV
jgi:hypothetical protein